MAEPTPALLRSEVSKRLEAEGGRPLALDEGEVVDHVVDLTLSVLADYGLLEFARAPYDTRSQSKEILR